MAQGVQTEMKIVIRHSLFVIRSVVPLFLISYFLFPFSSPVFADEPLQPIQGLSGGYQAVDLSGGETPVLSAAEKLISNILGFITVVAGLEFAIFLFLAGLTWITAREESSRLSKAKDMFTNALIGLVFVVGAWAFAGIAGTVFGFTILNPGQVILNNLLPNAMTGGMPGG